MTERLHEQAGSYALGVLPESERAEFEDALENSVELRHLVRELTDVAGAAALALPKRPPTPALKTKILERIANTPQPEAPAIVIPQPVRLTPVKPATRRDESNIVTFPAWLPWTAAAVFAILGGMLLADRARMHEREVKLTALLQEAREQAMTLAQNRDTLEHALAAAKTELASAQHTADLANTQVALLASKLSDQPNAVAVSVWNDASKEGVLVVENLALLPADKTYQLWVVDPSKPHPVDGGVFHTDATGNGRIEFKPKDNVTSASAFAISVEREGGVPVAEGPIVLVGATTRM